MLVSRPSPEDSRLGFAGLADLFEDVDLLADEITRLNGAASEGVRLLLTLYTPEEESCLHIFDAPSLALIEHASHQAGVPFDRVSPVIRIEESGA